MRALHPTRRRGMTMIELVVVIAMILVLATLALMLSPRLAEDQRSVRTADLVSGYLLMCKNRAYRDQQMRGIRLVPSANNPLECREILLIERPEDYRGGDLQVPSPFATGTVPVGKENATAFVHGKDLTNATNPTAEPIVEAYAQNQRGDFLVFDSLEPIPYNSHFIYSMTYFPAGASPQAPQGGTHIICATFDLQRYSIINGGAPIPRGSTYGKSDQFRFVRGPRPLVGEPPLQLPRDMIIDLTPPAPVNNPPQPPPPGTLEGGTFLPGAGTVDQYDLMFSPRGQLQGSNSSGGKVVLRIRNGTRNARDGDQLFVVIYTRSGIIAAHPVNVTADATGFLVSPYDFIRDGDSSGF
jgi:prepilin-type N-terminal cleavage/methylation domain-containing protein